MRNVDKKTQALLTVIAILLGVIALRPALKFATSAQAQTSADAQTQALNTTLLNRINFRDEVLGLEVMDHNKCFIVRTKNMVEVYRINTN